MSFNIADALRSDVFSLRSIIDYIDKKPYITQNVSLWLNWMAKGEYLPVAMIEFREGTLSLIPEAPRGAKGDSNDRADRSAVPVVIPHYPQTDTLLAESVRGVRAFGSELEQAFEVERNSILDSQHKRHLLRWEYSKVSAIKGLVYETNAAGVSIVKVNWFDKFGVVQHEVDIDLDDATTDVVAETIDAKALSEDELGEFDATEYVLICGRDFFKKYVNHPTQKAAWQRFNEGSFLRGDNRKGFPIANDVTVVEYGRGKIGGQWLIEPDEAYLCPVADDMYQTRYAPGTGISTLGEMGQPEYFSTKLLDHDEGVEMKASTSILSYVQRPRAVIKFKLA